MFYSENYTKMECYGYEDAYSDKILFKIFKNINEPKAILRNMNGLYFDSEYRKIEKMKRMPY